MSALRHVRRRIPAGVLVQYAEESKGHPLGGSPNAVGAQRTLDDCGTAVDNLCINSARGWRRDGIDFFVPPPPRCTQASRRRRSRHKRHHIYGTRHLPLRLASIVLRLNPNPVEPSGSSPTLPKPPEPSESHSLRSTLSQVSVNASD